MSTDGRQRSSSASKLGRRDGREALRSRKSRGREKLIGVLQDDIPRASYLRAREVLFLPSPPVGGEKPRRLIWVELRAVPFALDDDADEYRTLQRDLPVPRSRHVLRTAEQELYEAVPAEH